MDITSGADELLTLADDTSLIDDTVLDDESACTDEGVLDAGLDEGLLEDNGMLDDAGVLETVTGLLLSAELMARLLDDFPPLPLLSPPQATRPKIVRPSTLSLSGR